jgi:hypothetical protein
MIAETKKVTLLCGECNAEIDESEMFEFGGTVACETCVRKYYRDRPAEVELELQTRQRNAVRWVKVNRNTLEQQAAKIRQSFPC